MEQITAILDFLVKYKEAIGIILLVLGGIGAMIKWGIDKKSQSNTKNSEIRNEILELFSSLYKEKEFLMLNYYQKGEEVASSAKKFNNLQISLESKFLQYMPTLKNKFDNFLNISLTWEHDGGSSMVNPREDVSKMKVAYKELLTSITKEKIN